MTANTADDRFEQLARTLAPQSKLLGVWSLAGGISAQMTALEIEDPDGRKRRLIVRRPAGGILEQNPHAARDEFRLLKVTHSLGLATPVPYHLDQSGQIFSAPYLVIQYVEGQPEFAPADLAGTLFQLAEHLATIHSANCSPNGLSFLPVRQSECAEMCSQPPVQMNAQLDEARIRAVLASVGPLPQRNAPVLLHGDYWPGNILWQDNRLVAVIDWEDAALGDPLIDLAIARLDIAWIFGLEAMRLFTAQYHARMAIDYTNLPYWDLCAALRLVRLAGPDLDEWVAFFAPFGRPDITVQSLRSDYGEFIAQAFERLVI